jgi:hypothetical protein
VRAVENVKKRGWLDGILLAERMLLLLLFVLVSSLLFLLLEKRNVTTTTNFVISDHMVHEIVRGVKVKLGNLKSDARPLFICGKKENKVLFSVFF